jgi:AcrR family transcriptional regulator
MPAKALDLANTYVTRLRAEGLSSRDAVIAVDYTADLTVAAEIGVRRMARVFSTPRGERSLREIYDAQEGAEPLGGADRFARRGWLEDKLAILLDGLANRLGEPAAAGMVEPVADPSDAAPDREAITSVGLALARRGGLAAVSVHAVAGELATSVTSVRRVIGDRDGIVVAMLDAVTAKVVLPPPAADPRTEILTVVTALRTALAADRWALPAVTADGLTGPAVVPVLRRLFAAFRAAGLPEEAVAAATRVCWEHVCGTVLCQQPSRTFAHRLVESAGLTLSPAHDGGALGLSIVVDGLLARLG